MTSVEDKPYTRRPAAPFMTSTLQQEASRKLRFNPRQTMRLAQSLYENGYITYMRTDSVALSDPGDHRGPAAGRAALRPRVRARPPRVYTSRSKNAQEAHEAIRPAGDSFRTPAQVAGELRGDEFRLYELIWKRTVASQMADARGSTASVRLAVPVTGVTLPTQGTAADPGERHAPTSRRPARSSPSAASSPPTRRGATRIEAPKARTARSGGCRS